MSSTRTVSQNGIGNVNAPINSLIGVFLTSSQPDPSAVPSEFNFASSGLNFLSLAPGLQQPFFIGDGLTGPGGVVQSFIVPDGATRLFLGTMDEFEWRNNSGSFTVFGDLIAGRLGPDPGACDPSAVRRDCRGPRVGPSEAECGLA